jgi:hypothetical protein
MTRPFPLEQRGFMRRAVPILVGLFLLGGCGGEVDIAEPVGVAPSVQQSVEPIEIRTEVTIADEEGAETIATGEVLRGSTLGDAPFCVGGTIVDTHPAPDVDPDYLIEREITCPDGTVTIGLSPEVDTPPGEPQGGSWTIVSGSDDFEGLSGGGEMEVNYDPDDDSLAHEMLKGTATV